MSGEHHLPLRITVAIPVKPGGSSIKALESLKNIPSFSPVIEVILVEGCNPSFQRNEAGRLAKGDILYLLDDDSIVPPHLFQRVLSHFMDTKVIAVGGPSLTPVDDSFLQRCFGAALSSTFGSYKSHYRYASIGGVREASETDLIGCNLALRRKTFLDEGGLNTSLHPNEETELLDRLHQKGAVMLYDPEAYIYRSQRESVAGFISQVFSYGMGRVEQTFLRPYRVKPFYFIPLVFSFYLALLPLLRGILWAFAPLALYILLAIIASLWISLKNKDWRYLAVTPLIFLIIHVSHGYGLFWGLVSRPFTKRRKPLPSGFRITRYDMEGAPELLI